MFKDTTQLLFWFKESLDLLDDSRKLARKTLEYKEGEQLADDIKMTLNVRGQSEQYENNIEKFDTKIVGFQDTRQTQIGISGRQHEDKLSARILKDVIRGIQDENDFEVEKECSNEDMRIAGFAAQEIKVISSDETDSFGRTFKDIKIVNLPSSECFPDPFAKQEDYSDARHFTQAFYLNKEDLFALGFKEEDINKLHTNNYLDRSLDEYDIAYTSYSDRYLVCYTWYKEWNKKDKKFNFFYCYWSDNIILEQKKSPFEHILDGFPIVVEFLKKKKNRSKKISGYSGLYKNLICLQDSINQAKLKLFNMLGSSKVLVQTDSVDDIEIFKDEYNLDNAIVEVEDLSGIKDIRQYTEYQQIMNVIVDARNQMKEILGFNDELLAVANNRLSGEAIEKRLGTGTFGLADYFKKCGRLQSRTIEMMIPFIIEYYDATRIVKIIEADDNINYFTINEPQLDENGFMDYEQLEDGFVKPKTKNSIAVGKYDLVFKEEAKEVTSANERFRLNIEMLKTLQSINPAAAQQLMPDVYADSNAPIAEKLKGILSQLQAQPKGQDPKEQLELAELVSKINLNDSKAAYSKDKNTVDLLRINSNQNNSNMSNATKQDKILLDAMKGAI